ncbi:MAG TPA: hypothetical protein VMY42_27415 [Thermoguttaceae bacterium]|nr:hypothetical protein [Thermoguttaceae bacterium]
MSYKVLDKSGTPVPNAKITLVAVNPEGKSYGAEFTWNMARTNMDGCGASGFGTAPEEKPGRLQIIARHPSVGEVTTTADWRDVLHERPPLIKSPDEPMFVLKAHAGPGLAAWSDSVARKAPTLVESLLKAKNKKEIDAVTQELAACEMMAIPPLVAALQDYENPRRRRLVRAFIHTWNACNAQGPLDPAIRPKAVAIYSVNSHVGVLGEKPQSQPTFLRNCPDEAVLPVTREVAWVIRDLEAKIHAARQADDPDRIVGNLEMVLSKMREVEKQTKELRRDDRN